LRKAFGLFDAKDTIESFAQRSVRLKTEPDGRMFPTTDESGTIIDCLMRGSERLGVQVSMGTGVAAIAREGVGFALELTTGRTQGVDRVIVTSGGHPKAEGYDWLRDLGHTIVPPVPSLFTFNMPDEPVREL